MRSQDSRCGFVAHSGCYCRMHQVPEQAPSQPPVIDVVFPACGLKHPHLCVEQAIVQLDHYESSRKASRCGQARGRRCLPVRARGVAGRQHLRRKLPRYFSSAGGLPKLDAEKRVL